MSGSITTALPSVNTRLSGSNPNNHSYGTGKSAAQEAISAAGQRHIVPPGANRLSDASTKTARTDLSDGDESSHSQASGEVTPSLRERVQAMPISTDAEKNGKNYMKWVAVAFLVATLAIFSLGSAGIIPGAAALGASMVSAGIATLSYINYDIEQFTAENNAPLQEKEEERSVVEGSREHYDQIEEALVEAERSGSFGPITAEERAEIERAVEDVLLEERLEKYFGGNK